MSEEREVQIGSNIFRLVTLPDGSYESFFVRSTSEPEPEPLIPPTGTLAEVPSRSTPGVKHYVLSTSTGIKCTCFGFRAPEHCWHYKLVKSVLDEGVTLEELIRNPLILK